MIDMNYLEIILPCCIFLFLIFVIWLAIDELGD